MLAKFSVSKVKNRSTLKNSLVNKLKLNAVQYIPRLAEIELPKKVPVIIHTLPDHQAIYSVNGDPILIQRSDGCIFPALRLAMEYPGLLPRIHTDFYATAAILRGANLMSAGAWDFDPEIKAGTVVEICYIEADVPFAIGVTLISGEEILKREQGPCVKIEHYLRDGLWESRKL